MLAIDYRHCFRDIEMPSFAQTLLGVIQVALLLDPVPLSTCMNVVGANLSS